MTEYVFPACGGENGRINKIFPRRRRGNGRFYMETIRICGVIRQSIVDGPGLRFVVFTQGCPHKCEGCHNPQTHPFNGGYDCDIEKILAEIEKNPLLRGITLSGGEPFCRSTELLPLVKAVRAKGMDVFCYSGYTFEELAAMSEIDASAGELLGLIDVLVDGRFVLAQRDLELKFRGSRNQRVLDIKASLKEKRPVEINFDAGDGYNSPAFSRHDLR